MKNRKLLLVVSLVLALTMSLGGTLAYLQDTDEAVNVMTLGKVDIEQLENGQKENGFVNGQPLYPAYYTGDDWKNATDIKGDLKKEVNVENVGTSDAYIRTVFAVKVGDMTADEFEKYIHLDWNVAADALEWVTDGHGAKAAVNIVGSNYYIVSYTYPEEVKGGALAGVTLKRVVMDKKATNDIVSKLGDSYEILVVTQAVQTANMDSLGAKGALNEAFGALSATSHPWSDWNGTSDDELPGNIIASKEDLLALAGKNIEGTYTLMANIDMGGEELETIGAAYGKTLVFNGNGYTISNAKLVTGNHNSMPNTGLFYAFTNSNLTVSNLKLKNVSSEGINGNYTIGVAAVVGYADGGSTVTLNNVDVVNAKIKNEYGNAAMLIGYTVGKVNLTDCDVTGTAVGEKEEKQGAYIGTANTDGCVVTITNCTNGTGLNDIGRKINDATASGETVKVADQDGLMSAISEGATSVKLAAGSYAMPDAKNKKVTLVGTGENTVLDMAGVSGNYQNVSGADLTFENMTIVYGTAFYKGLQHAANVTYKNCTIKGLQFLYAPTVTFENCDLDSNGGEHCIWTYGAQNITFTDCDFTYTDRAVNVYLDNGTGSQTVSFDGCKFSTTNTASKGAVEINSSVFPQGVTVTMNDCTAPAYGTMVGISGWDGTNGANATVMVNGVEIEPTQWTK